MMLLPTKLMGDCDKSKLGIQDLSSQRHEKNLGVAT